MRQISAEAITQAVKGLCMTANYALGDDVMDAYRTALQNEESETGRAVLAQIIENAEIARNQEVPSCQDTGVAVFFIDLGQDVQVVGGDFNQAIEDGVLAGYGDGYLRKSMCDPFTRKNTGTNLPAVIHVRIVPGGQLRIQFAAKGGGSENMSTVMMMKPADGKKGIINAVTEWVKKAGPNPCPPVIVGVGIGGNFEMSAMLAKRALMRKMGVRNAIPEIAELEATLKEKINNLGIGPMGFGGRTTTLDVNVEYMPCHIASLPVAVNIQCHANRHREIEL